MYSIQDRSLATSIAIFTAIISSYTTYYFAKERRSKNVSDNDDKNENNRQTQHLKSKITHEIITTRRTISQFEPELPPDWEVTVKQAIQAAITAPNHKRTEPWRFYIPNREAIIKICELNASIVAQGKGGAKAGEAKLKRWLKVPGWIVVTCTKHQEIIDDSNNGNGNTSNTYTNSKDIITMEDPKGRDREDYAAVCCACQNMSLSLHSNGYGTKWSTGKVNFDKRFDDIVGIPSDSEYVVGTFWFGIPLKKGSSRETKHGVNDVLSISH